MTFAWALSGLGATVVLTALFECLDALVQAGSGARPTLPRGATTTGFSASATTS